MDGSISLPARARTAGRTTEHWYGDRLPLKPTHTRSTCGQVTPVEHLIIGEPLTWTIKRCKRCEAGLAREAAGRAR